jgi:formylglycine-generating enzyme required for sulfatase activity
MTAAVFDERKAALMGGHSFEVWDAVQIPGGEYQLGDADDVRKVAVADLEFNRYPVTVCQYLEFVQSTAYPTTDLQERWMNSSHLADHPMVHVTFADAERFSSWASAQYGLGLRLPSADEWEAAARYPLSYPFPWGEHPDHERCNGSDAGWGGTCSVDQYPEGRTLAGIADLSGNVWEWTSTRDTQSGWNEVRGGSFMDIGWGLRLARGLLTDPARATATTGFRLCRTAP